MRKRTRYRAGDLDTRVVLYQQDATTEANTDGEIPEEEDELGRRWAAVVGVKGQLRYLAGTNEANITHVVRMRYDDVTKALTPANWIERLDDSTRLNIASVVDVEDRRQWIECECTERVT